MTAERLDTATIMAQRLAMAYITASIANGYLEESIDDMKKLNIFHYDVKRKASMAKGFFDNFDGCMKWFFDIANSKTVGANICNDYSALQESCDRFMMAGIHLSPYQTWNNDDARAEDRYLCRVDGAKDTDIMILKWKNRQWLMYVNSTVGAGWMALSPSVRVTEVVDRIAKNVEQKPTEQ